MIKEVVNKINLKWSNNNSPILKNTNGNFKLANDLIIQWSSISIPSNRPRNTYSFIIAFTSINYKILVTEGIISFT